MGDRQTNSVIADGSTPMSARPADDGRAKLIEMRSRRGESTHPRTATADPAAAPCYYPRLEVGMLRLTLAAGHYDRTEAFRDGRVRAEGIDLTYIMLRVEEIFWRMAQHREFDASEFSLGFACSLYGCLSSR